MNQNIPLAIAIIAVALSIGTFAATSMNAIEVQKDVTELKTTDEELWNQFVSINENTLNREGDLLELIQNNTESLKIVQEDHQTLSAQVTEQQAATKTLSKNQIDIPETTETKKSFYLKVTDVTQNPRDTFRLNEIAYFSGKADDTTDHSITYKILSPPPFPLQLYKSTIAIPDNGTFPIYWIIPPNLESGTYTLQVSDGDFKDSITFKVE